MPFNPLLALKNLFRPPRREGGAFPAGLISPWELRSPSILPGNYRTYIEAFKDWIYKCVNKIAIDVGSIKLNMYHKDRNGKIEEVEKHIFLDLLKHVNPSMNETELKEDTQMFLDLTGNAYWYIVKNGFGVPTEIWTIPSQHIQVIPSKETFIAGYIYSDGSVKIPFREDEIIHFKYPNPKNKFYGYSPIQAGIHQINLSDYMNDYQDTLYKNRARPDVILMTAEDLNEDEVKRQLSYWENLYKGGKKAGKAALLTRGTEAKPFSISPTELDFMESRKFTREEICSFYNIPLVKMGLGKEVGNRSVAEVLDYTYAKECLEPRLKRIATKINEKIMPLYKTDGEFFVEFESVVPEDKAFLLKERESNIKIGFTSINEERQKVGIEPSPWGEVPLMPMSYMPVNAGGGKEEGMKAITKGINLFHARKKRIHNIQTDRMEKRYSLRIRKMFKDWHDKILENMDKLAGKSLTVTKDFPDYILIPLANMREEFGKMSIQEIQAAIEAGFFEVFAEAGFEVIWDPNYGLVVQHIRDRSMKIKTIVEQYHNEIKQILADGIKEGKGIPELRKDFHKWFTETEHWKADRIARTEIGSARNSGEYTYGHECEQITEKTWLHSHGPNARPEHEAMDGITIPKDELFFVLGEGLRFPGDYEASAENIVNCRCTLIFQ